MSHAARRRVVLDTDTYNEVDDQFALAHLLLAAEAVDLRAVYAAPFANPRSSGPADGMEKSFHEINKVIDLVAPEIRPPVFRGSTAFLPGPETPVESAAAADLVEQAMAVQEGEQLYVLAIGASTNVASAILLEPRIAEKVTVVWLGGHAPTWPDTREFNLQQDVHAARVLLDGPAPLVLIPCNPVASHLAVTVPELEKHLEPYSDLGRYLTEIVRGYGDSSPGWSKIIWDIAVSAWAIQPEWVLTSRQSSPILRDDLTWDRARGVDRKQIEIAHSVLRDGIFGDFFVRAQRSDRPRADETT